MTIVISENWKVLDNCLTSQPLQAKAIEFFDMSFEWYGVTDSSEFSLKVTAKY